MAIKHLYCSSQDHFYFSIYVPLKLRKFKLVDMTEDCCGQVNVSLGKLRTVTSIPEKNFKVEGTKCCIGYVKKGV